MTAQYFNIIPALILILMLIIGLALLVRRFAPALTRSTSRLQLLSSLSLGGKERAVLIKAGEEYLLLGVSPGRVQILHTLDKENMPPEGLAPSPPASAGFASILQNLSRKY